jgi:hypothetical protein
MKKMNATRRANAALAKTLRELARRQKICRVFGLSFTCNAVENACNAEVRAAYEATFGFSPTFGYRGAYEGNEIELWTQFHDDERNDIRVLLLCFAAAMAETGDLL